MRKRLIAWILNICLAAGLAVVPVSGAEETDTAEEYTTEMFSEIPESEADMPMEMDLIPAAVTIAYGSCGAQASWMLDDAGTLTVYGSGSMTDYDYLTGAPAPWVIYFDQIKSVVINNGITTVGNGAFAGCSRLQQVSIPVSVIRIGENAFASCTQLRDITVAAQNGVYSSVNGVLFDKNKTTLLKYPAARTDSSYVVAGSVTKIGSQAFYGNPGLTALTIPGTVKEIGSQAFYDCGSLASVYLGSGVAVIGESAFARCPGLKQVSIPDSVTQMGARAFEECSSLTTVQIGSGLAEISAWAFSNCAALSSILIPGNVHAIGDGAFYQCTGLGTVRLGTGLESIGYAAFYRCAAALIQLPESLTTVSDRAFEENASLQTVTVPASVTNIGEDVFRGCEKLTLYVEQNSRAESYAESHEIPYRYMDELEDTPFAVTGLRASSQTNGQIELTWDAVLGADGYLIYASKNGQYGYAGITANTSFADTKAPDGIYSFYWVYPYYMGADGKRVVGTCSQYVYAMAKKTLAAVTGLKAQGTGKGQVTLTWNPVEGATGYVLYSKKGEGTYGYLYLVLETTYTDKNALDTDYNFYWVFPYYIANGKRNITTNKNYTYAIGRYQLPAVANLKATSMGTGVTLSWSGMPEADGYLIYAKTQSTATMLIGETMASSFVDTKAPAGEFRFYWVYPYYLDSVGERRIGKAGQYVYGKKSA